MGEKKSKAYSFLFGLILGNKGIPIAIHIGYLSIILILILKIIKVF